MDPTSKPTTTTTTQQQPAEAESKVAPPVVVEPPATAAASQEPVIKEEPSDIAIKQEELMDESVSETTEPCTDMSIEQADSVAFETNEQTLPTDGATVVQSLTPMPRRGPGRPRKEGVSPIPKKKK